MSQNWLRSCSIALSGGASKTITGGGPSDLRISFKITQQNLQTPATGYFKIWNPSQDTVAAFQNKEFQKLVFTCGYQGNTGVLFTGDVVQSIDGHENATDTYIDIYCADGDNFYNRTVMSTTLAAGHTPMDRVNAALAAGSQWCINLGNVNVDLSKPSYPRGIPLVGMAKDVLRQVASTAGAMWSIQQDKLNIVDQRQQVSANTITLTAETGLIGWPRQTIDGVETTSLINPALQPLVNIKLDPTQIIAAQQALFVNNQAALEQNRNLAAQNYKAGTYNVFRVERQGDTRGQEWYDVATSIGQGGSLSPANIQAGYSQAPGS